MTYLAYVHRVGRNSSVGIATGYGLDGPGIESWWGTRFFTSAQTGPGAHPASCIMVTGSFLGVKSGRGVTLTPHPLLVPWSRKGRAIPLLPLWAVWPVQSLSASSRVHFTFTYFHRASLFWLRKNKPVSYISLRYCVVQRGTEQENSVTKHAYTRRSSVTLGRVSET